MDIAKLQELMKNKKASMKRVERAKKLNPGKNRIRLLPGWRAGEEHIWFHDFGQHFIKDATGAILAVYLCAESTFSKPCSVCSTLQAASRSASDDVTQKTLSEARASKVILVNALMLDSTEPNTPVILELKGGTFTQLIEIMEEWGAEAFFGRETGHEIVITRDGKGLNTTYTAQLSPKVYEVPVASMARLNNLDEYVQQQSEEQERRAIAAINGVAGILPAPTPGVGDMPATTATRLLAPSASAPAAVASPARSDVALDDELDALLSDLPE